MNKDQFTGFIILFTSILGILIYGWLMFFTTWSILALQISAFVAVAVVLAILAWIGYTLATTSPPESIEEIEKELSEEKEKKESKK